jgi:hypothetical protein
MGYPNAIILLCKTSYPGTGNLNAIMVICKTTGMKLLAVEKSASDVPIPPFTYATPFVVQNMVIYWLVYRFSILNHT